MGGLLEIFGRAITVDTADLILHWLNNNKANKDCSQTTQNEQLSKIINLLGDMQLDAAQDLLRLYLFENPSCTFGRMAAAAICLHKNQLSEAIEELNSIYLRQPNNTTVLYALGHCFERLGKESQAVEFYQDCLKFKSYFQFPCQRLAAVYFKNGQLEKTIQQYEQLKEQYPDDISSLITLGYLYIAGAKYTEAIETFNTAILMHPDIFLTENEDIEQLIQAGHLKTALQHLEDLSDQQFDNPELIIKQADVLGLMGETAEAISQYQHALRICPDFLEATIKLGTQYLRMDAEHLAAEQFNRAFEINEKIVDAYMGIATAQKLSGFFSEALSTLSLAAAIQPNSSLLFAETSKLLFKIACSDSIFASEFNESNDFIEPVITSHQQQIARQPQNSDLYYRLGILMMSVGHIMKAIEYLNITLKINPTYDRAKSKLAICLFEADDKYSSFDLVNAPDYLDKNTLSLYYETALLYCNKVKFASSLINLDRFLEDNFADSGTTINISIVLQNLGLIDRVAAMWNNLMETTEYAKRD